MKKIFATLLLASLPVMVCAQTTVTGLVAEDEVQATGGIFDDSAFEPGVLAVDMRGASPVVVFAENNHTTGANTTTVYSYDVTSDDSSDAGTLEITGEDETDTGDLQTALATTGNVFFRQGGGSISGANVYLLCADKGTSTSEYLSDSDADVLVQVNIDTNAATIVSSDDGALSTAAVGNNVFVELDESAGAAGDGIGMIDVSGSLPGSYTTIVTETQLETIMGATAGNGVDIHGIASTPSGSILALVAGDVGGEAAQVIEVSDPAGTPSLSVLVSSAVLNGSSLGAIAPLGIDCTATTGQIVVHSGDSDSGGVDPYEGYLHISPDGVAVLNVVTATEVLAGSDLGTGADAMRNFDGDEVVAYEDSGNLVIVATSQDNEEFIALVTITGTLNVEDWSRF
jgi:hypothetical protein